MGPSEPTNISTTRPKSEPPPSMPPRATTVAYSPAESANIRAQLIAARVPVAPTEASTNPPTRAATMAYSADESARIRAALTQAAKVENASSPSPSPPTAPSNGIAVTAPKVQNPSATSPTYASGNISPVQMTATAAPNPPIRKSTLAYSPQESAALQAQLNAKNNEIPTGTSRVTGLPVEAARLAPATSDAKSPPVRKDTMAYSSEESAAVREELTAAQRNDAALLGGQTLPAQGPDLNAMDLSSTPATVVTILSRDAEPTPASPLLYRERCYFAPAGTDSQSARALLTQELLGLQRTLAGRDRGILVSLALFDHYFEVRPERGPIATLEWKDWRGDPVFVWHNAATAEPAQAAPSSNTSDVESSPHESGIRAPSAALATPFATVPAPSDAWAGRDVTGEQDRRLAHAFEAAQDLYFLGSVADGLDFGVKLLAELIPCEAISGCLYDINTNEFRFVALTGPGADDRRAQAVPATSGIMGVAAQAPEELTLVRDVATDERFDPGIDGRTGLTPRSMLLFPMRSGESLLGMLQLINRERREFTDGDVAVGAYVAKQVGEFLQTKRATARQPR